MTVGAGMPFDTGSPTRPGETGLHRPEGVRITPSRERIDNRFPSLSFVVNTAGLRYFEVLLTVDRRLFDPLHAHERSAHTFYSSRQDAGLIDTAAGQDIYLVPQIVLQQFASGARPLSAIYYTAVAYADAQGSIPRFAIPPHDLPNSAPHVAVAPGFTGQALSRMYGRAMATLRTLGTDGRLVEPSALSVPPVIGDLPVLPAPGRNADVLPPTQHVAGKPESTPPIIVESTPGTDLPDLTFTDEPAPAMDDYDDGFSEPEQILSPITTSPAPQSEGVAYGDDDYRLKATSENGQPSEAETMPDTSGVPPTIPPMDDPGIAEPQPFSLPAALAFNDADEASPAPREPLPDSPATIAPSDSPSARNGDLSASLDDDARRRIIERVGELRHPAVRYDAVNLDGAFRGRGGKTHPYYQRAHDGLSYGIAQFNQDSGQLGRLLRYMQSRDPAKFADVFGASSEMLLDTTNALGPSSLQSPSGRSARVQPIDGKDLWEEPWLGRFKLAAAHAPFQAAQNQAASELFLEPMVDVAAWLGILSERGLAVLFDLAVRQQPGPATNFVVASLATINDQALREDALRFVSANGATDSVADFQRSHPALEETGEWDSRTVAALEGRLREAGPNSPLTLKTYGESLMALRQSAEAQPFAADVARLIDDDSLRDDMFSR